MTPRFLRLRPLAPAPPPPPMTPELSPSDIYGRELPAGAVVLEEEGGVAGRSGPSELDEYLALRRRFEPDEGGRDVP